MKAMAVEPDDAPLGPATAAYVATSFRTATLATVAHEGSFAIGKLVTAATLWLGLGW